MGIELDSEVKVFCENCLVRLIKTTDGLHCKKCGKRWVWDFNKNQWIGIIKVSETDNDQRLNDLPS